MNTCGINVSDAGPAPGGGTMVDENRKQNRDREEPMRDRETAERPNERDVDEMERRTPRREPSDIAEDRGLGERGKRGFGGDREADDLGSEMEDETRLDEVEEDDDVEGGTGRRNR
jgi:hypothetical protein